MTDRPTRYGVAPPTTGGALSRPIAGLGCLLPGTHAVTVLSLTRTAAGRWTVILQAPSNECHIETLDTWPMEWRTGTQLKLDIVHTPGYVLYHSHRGFQARDALTLDASTEWLPTASDVYAKMLPTLPASTCIGKASDGNRDLVPGVHPTADVGAGTPDPDATPR